MGHLQHVNLAPLWLAMVVAGGGLALAETIRACLRRNRQHTGRRT